MIGSFFTNEEASMAVQLFHSSKPGTYSAVRLKTPGALLPSSPNDVERICEETALMVMQSRQAQVATAKAVNDEKNAVVTKSGTHSTSIAPLAVAFISTAIGTARHWNDPGFDPTSNLVALAFMVYTLFHTVILYWLHHRQLAITQTKAQRDNAAQAIYKVFFYLDSSGKMAKACLAPDLQASLPALFARFDTFSKKQKAGVVPNDLGNAWGKVGPLIQALQNEGSIDPIKKIVQEEIFPLNDDYKKQLQQKLAALGVPSIIELNAPPLQNQEEAIVIDE